MIGLVYIKSLDKCCQQRKKMRDIYFMQHILNFQDLRKLKNTFIQSASAEKISTDEIKLQKDVYKKSFKSENITFLLVIDFGKSLKIKRDLNLSKLVIVFHIKISGTVNGKQISL